MSPDAETQHAAVSEHDHFIRGLVPPTSALPAPALDGAQRLGPRAKRGWVLFCGAMALGTASALLVAGGLVSGWGRSPSPEQVVRDYTEAMHEHRFADAWELLCSSNQEIFDSSLQTFAEAGSLPEAATHRTFVITGKADLASSNHGWRVPVRREPDGQTGTFFVVDEKGALKVCLSPAT